MEEEKVWEIDCRLGEEEISEAVLAIRHGLTVEQLGETIHAHPTVSEVLMEAAHDVEGLCCHKL